MSNIDKRIKKYICHIIDIYDEGDCDYVYAIHPLMDNLIEQFKIIAREEYCLEDGKLKPCPFCGSEDIKTSSDRRICGHGETSEVFKIYCVKCGCSIEIEDYNLTEYQKINLMNKWNCRSNDDH